MYTHHNQLANWLKLCVHWLDGTICSFAVLQDMYVDFELAQETASKILGVRQWVTNEYMHSGIRDDGARILERLLGIVRGSIPLT